MSQPRDPGDNRHMQRAFLLAFSLFLVFGADARAQHPNHGAAAPPGYAGEERRDIKSLSADDIAELRRGGGWGLAKPAELNGIPGPAHLLELKHDIPLTAEQVARIEAIYQEMKAQAVAEGERLIAREQALEDAFRARSVTEASLRSMLTAIEQSRAALRYIHLSTHLAMPGLLSPAQTARYAALRGYAANACDAVPPGHDARMWRLHNGCK